MFAKNGGFTLQLKFNDTELPKNVDEVFYYGWWLMSGG